MSKKITVVQPEKELPTEVIANAIVEISEGIKRLRAGRINDKALYLLIQHAAPSRGYGGGKVGMGDVKNILEGIESLESTFLKKKAH